MAVIKSGASSDFLFIDPVSKAVRVTPYDSAGRELTNQNKAFFSASSAFTPAATPTDLVTISGSSLKTVRVLSLVIITTNTAAGSQQFFLVKRSTTDTLGTFVQATPVQHDSKNNPPTAIVGCYTANPTLGNTVGTINIIRVASPLAVGSNWSGITFNAGHEMIPIIDGTLKPVTLRGLDESLCLNFNGVALVSGQIHAYRVVWIEE